MKIIEWPDGETMPLEEYEDVVDAWRGDDFIIRDTEDNEEAEI